MPFQFDPKRWLLLTGDEDGVLELAVALGMKYRKTSAMDFAHSNIITILAPDGRIAYQTPEIGADISKTLKAIRKCPESESSMRDTPIGAMDLLIKVVGCGLGVLSSQETRIVPAAQGTNQSVPLAANIGLLPWSSERSQIFPPLVSQSGESSEEHSDSKNWPVGLRTFLAKALQRRSFEVEQLFHRNVLSDENRRQQASPSVKFQTK